MKEQGFYGFREKGVGNRFQSFALELVAGCQLKCGNCYRSPKYKRGEMPIKFALRAIEMAKEAGFSEAVMIGGEPTLHNNLPLIIKRAADIGLLPIICTNGIRLADFEYCRRIALSGSTIVLHGPISLLPGEMDKHVKFDGYSELLLKAYQNLDRLKNERNLTIVSEAVVIRPFLSHLLRFHIWCRENGYVPFIEVNRRGNDRKPNGLSVSPEEANHLFLDLQQWDRENFPELMDQVLTPPAYGTKCTMSVTGLHVKNFGEGECGGVYSCCAQTICHGDLNQKTLQEILASQSLEIFQNQDEWIAGPCRECEVYSQCRGGCRGEAVLAFGCSRASCPACWRIPVEVRNDPKKMTPESCAGCPVEGHPECRLER